MQFTGDPMGNGCGALCQCAGCDHGDDVVLRRFGQPVWVADAARKRAALAAPGHGDRILSAADIDGVAVSAVLFSLWLERGIFPHEHKRVGIIADRDDRIGTAFVTRGIVALPEFTQFYRRPGAYPGGGICRLAEVRRDWIGGGVGIVVRAGHFPGIVGAVLWEAGILILRSCYAISGEIE